MAVVLVGAMIVAGIETVWDGQIAPFASREIATSLYPYQNITLNKGDEMGRFKLGSTAVVLFVKDKIQWGEQFKAASPTKMGERMGKII